MRKRLLPSLVVFVAIILDVTVLPMLSRHWLMPLFSLITVNCFGLLLGRTRGLWHGLVSGLMVDITIGTPLGLMTLLYAAVGYLGGIMGRAFPRSRLTPTLAGALGQGIVESVMAVYLVWSSSAFDQVLLTHAVARVALNAGCVTVLYWLYNWMLRPSRSRFAAR